MDAPTPTQKTAAAPLPMPRAVKVLLRIAFALFLAAIACIHAGRIYIHRAMLASLPQVDGSIRVAGLTAPVTIIRDARGMPHIRAASLDDLAFAQGYITAQDRLWQMDMLRRHAAGEFAEILGPGQLQHDETQRFLQIRNTADTVVSQMQPEELRYLDDYSRGVNALIAADAGHLPAEFRVLHYTPRPWQPRDCVLIGLVIVQELTTGFPIKLAREQLAAKLPPDLLADLYPVGSWRDHPPGQPLPGLTAPQTGVPDAPLDETQTRLHKPDTTRQDDTQQILALEHTLTLTSHFGCDGCKAGSNEWAVSGQHTASGKPLLSNDMHLPHTLPGLWYMAELAAPTSTGTLHVTGVTLPGVPFVIVGHNDTIAWGFTNLGGDVQDIYVEHTRNRQEYQTTDGAWHPLAHHTERIHVRGGLDVTLDVLSTNHGPIITPMLQRGDPNMNQETRDLSLRWSIYDPGTVDLPLLAIDSATNWTEFCDAMSHLGAPAQNAVYADVAGNIGYHAIGRIPVRGSMDHPSGLSATPIDASEAASYEWTGYIPFDQLPQAFDPPGGVLATANSRVTPDGYPFSITLNWEAPYRNERIWKQLEDAHNLKPSDMLALETDIHSDVDQEMAQRFAYAIDHATSATPMLRQAADLMRAWNGDVTIDSPAANIVDAAKDALWPLLLQPHLGSPHGDDWQIYQWGEMSYVEEELVMHQPARWLPPEYASWDDLLAAAVNLGLRGRHAHANLAHWPYGLDHRIDIEHPLFGQMPLLRLITHLPVGTGSLPQSGDTTTIKQVRGEIGPSERFTADLSDLDNSTLNIVSGESGNVLSPWFHDQWEAWYQGTTYPLPFSSAAVAQAAAHTLTLLPQ
ncbi:MAG TPA: penicillin acylase family protein [Acidobacteriaceae bacterium]|nr:penicillin acylase family protein [Acidobacteriaceae bacterium]